MGALEILTYPIRFLLFVVTYPLRFLGADFNWGIL